jgi:DNA mismatch repair protein MutS2
MNLDARTLVALDWPYVLDALARHARTEAGARAARELAGLNGIAAVHTVMDAVDETAALRDGESGPVPVGGIEDISEWVERAARGRPLEKDDLRATGSTIAALAELGTFADRHRGVAPTIAAWADSIRIDSGFRSRLTRAFDEHGELSESAYPVLGELRRRIAALERRARRMLEELLGSQEFGEHLQDNYVTVRDDRLVVPLKVQAKNLDLGIVHDASRTGQTVYVEPRQVVPINNERRIAEAELAAEERRILEELSADVGAHAATLYEALDAATQIDLAAARADFARRLGATRPEVGDRGVIRLRAARHPVLLLGPDEVVGNDLNLSDERPVLVLTGPNAGGKTVALKTLGLAAQLVRVGCFVPAIEGSRVDHFNEVLADIGDQQTVHGGLSSFSGHLTCLHQMTERAGPGSLLLLDELASGTDPTQGGALARALVERFAQCGARVVTTTHYAQVKAMGASDERVCVAAMEYLGDRPSYRVIEGMAGESHAFPAAARIGFDERILERARALMDEGERALGDALAGLEEERARSRELTRLLEESTNELEARERKVASREKRIQERADRLSEEAAAGFIGRVREADREIARIVAQLQRAPNSRRAAAARAALAAQRDGVFGDNGVENATASAGGEGSKAEAGRGPGRPDSGSGMSDDRALEVGDRVRIEKMGLTGEVLRLRRDEVEISAGNLTLRVPLADVVRAGGSSASRTGADERANRPRNVRASRRSVARVAKQGDVSEESAGGVRTEANTLDLRGERVADGLRRLEAFLDDSVLRGDESVFVLHGHGTGAMKEAVRHALDGSPYVSAFERGAEDQGGDGVTRVILR